MRNYKLRRCFLRHVPLEAEQAAATNHFGDLCRDTVGPCWVAVSEPFQYVARENLQIGWVVIVQLLDAGFFDQIFVEACVVQA